MPTTTPTPADCPVIPVVICEVKALLKYAADQGLDTEGLIMRPLYTALQDAEEQEASVARGEPPPPSLKTVRVELIVRYSQLTELTRPVTGRSVMDTEGPTWKLLWPLYVVSGLLLLMVVTNEAMSVWFSNIPEPEDASPLLWAMEFRRYFLEVCEPFVWGALGSCVYLLKRLSDFAEARCYDSTITSGWATRILLGSILGGVVQYLYDPSSFSADGLQVKAGALGFLTGVGVKVVYGAIEKTISVLAEKLNLDNVRKVDKEKDVVRAFLTKELARTDNQADPSRRELVLALIEQTKAAKPDK